MSEERLVGPRDDDLVRVEVFGSRALAEVARGALAARGIPSTLIADDGGGVGGVTLSLDHQGAELRVPRGSWAEARQLLGLSSEPSVAPRRMGPWAVLLATTLILTASILIALSIAG